MLFIYYKWIVIHLSKQVPLSISSSKSSPAQLNTISILVASSPFPLVVSNYCIVDYVDY